MKMLRTARKSNKLTMRELGEKVGVSESAISQYETGKREADFETIIKIAEVLDCSIDYLLGRTDQKEKPAPTDGDGLDDKALEEKFRQWFREQSPDRQKEVLFDLAKAVPGHDE